MLRYVVVRVTGKCYTLYFITFFQAVYIFICVSRLYSYQLFLEKAVKFYFKCIHINITEYISITDSRTNTLYCPFIYYSLTWSDNYCGKIISNTGDALKLINVPFFHAFSYNSFHTFIPRHILRNSNIFTFCTVYFIYITSIINLYIQNSA